MAEKLLNTRPTAVNLRVGAVVLELMFWGFWESELNQRHFLDCFCFHVILDCCCCCLFVRSVFLRLVWGMILNEFVVSEKFWLVKFKR